MIKKLIFLMVWIMAISFSGSVWAQNLQDATLTNYQDELNRIKLSKGSESLATELQQTQQWLTVASQATQDGDRELANRYLKRIRFSLVLLDALLVTKSLDAAVLEQQQMDKELPAKVEALKAEIADLKRQREELQDQIAQMRRR